MSGLHGMNGRVDRLEEKAPKPPEPQPDLLADFTLSLFTGDEQERFRRFIEEIESRFVEQLTGSELNEVMWWCGLYIALERSDQATAAQYRRYLATSDEELLARFLGIHENSIPGCDSVTGTYPGAPKLHGK